MTLVCASLATLALIACGGGSGGSPRAAVDDSSCIDEATATAMNAARDSASADEATPDRWPFAVPDDEAHCRLRRALLTVADLPTGWSAEDFGGSGRAYEDDNVGCKTPLPHPVAGLVVYFHREETPDGEIQAIMQWVYGFEEGGGSDVMAALKRNCPLVASSEGSAGDSYEFIDLPSFGDESLAVHDAIGIGEALEDSDQGNTDQLYIRRGDVVSLFSILTSGDPDVRRVAEMADARLATTGPIPEPTPVTGQGCATAPTPEPERANEISPGLLSLDDMPVGWVHDPPGPCGMIDREGRCDDSGHPYSPPTPLVEANTGFSGQREAYIANRVALFSAGEAEAFMEGVRQRVGAPRQCSASMDGRPFVWHYDPLDAPRLGEDAIAWHVTTQGLVYEVDVYVLMIRRGRAVASLSLRPAVRYLDLGAAEPARNELAAFVELADKKLQLVKGATAD